MSRRIDHQALTLLREIRDLVQLLVLRQHPAADAVKESLERWSDFSDRHTGSWSSIHGRSRQQR